MTLRLLSIGKTNTAYVKDGMEVYMNRLKHYVKIQCQEIPDVKNARTMDKPTLIKKEGEAFMTTFKSTDFVILLDEQGKQSNSLNFASWLEHRMAHHGGDLVFVIGGAYGFSEAVYTRCDAKISLSSMTFNHQLVRLVFLEQLYRAFTILRNEPYHHQ